MKGGGEGRRIWVHKTCGPYETFRFMSFGGTDDLLSCCMEEGADVGC